jgi:hypothetical protein
MPIHAGRYDTKIILRLNFLYYVVELKILSHLKRRTTKRFRSANVIVSVETAVTTRTIDARKFFESPSLEILVRDV